MAVGVSNYIMVRSFSTLVLVSLLILSCTKQESPETTIIEETPPPNILFVIADDMGKDATPNYSEGQEQKHFTVEVIDKLA